MNRYNVERKKSKSNVSASWMAYRLQSLIRQQRLFLFHRSFSQILAKSHRGKSTRVQSDDIGDIGDVVYHFVIVK